MGKGGHGGCGGGAHSHSVEYPDDSWNLYQHIATAEALNCATNDALPVFRPFVRRLEAPGPLLRSDGDEEVLVKVTFRAPVSVRRIMVVGGGDAEGHPVRVKVYVGREDVDFQSLEETTPTMTTSLPVNPTGEAYVATHPPHAFTNISAIAFFFDKNSGDIEETVLQYIGMQGEHTHDKREPVNATYELVCQGHGTQTEAGFQMPEGM
ncbi:galactose-binding domain-like protein [Pelagophyceae sp. CCMP2097]|nr:galactose-binding domain-like protein [Pelagophyceae sp. CCMP2097]